jgi:hypothetical protein
LIYLTVIVKIILIIKLGDEMLDLDRINSVLDYGTNSSIALTETIVAQPATLKKVLEFVEKTIKGLDYYEGSTHCPELVNGMKSVMSFIGFYDLYKGLIFWVNPFSSKQVDQKRLQESLLDSLKDEQVAGKPVSQDFIDRLVATVVKSKCFTKKEFKEAIKTALTNSISKEKAEDISRNVQVYSKPREVVNVSTAFCTTILNVKSCIGSFDRFQLIDSAQLSAQMGKNMPVLLFVMKGAAQAASNGLILIGFYKLACAVQELIRAQNVINSAYSATDEEEVKNEAHLLKTKALWEIASGVTFLASSTISLAFVVSTPALLILGLVANGTAILKIFAKPV